MKSPGGVEIAGAERVDLTTAGELDIAANTARMVAGHQGNLFVAGETNL